MFIGPNKGSYEEVGLEYYRIRIDNDEPNPLFSNKSLRPCVINTLENKPPKINLKLYLNFNFTISAIMIKRRSCPLHVRHNKVEGTGRFNRISKVP